MTTGASWFGILFSTWLSRWPRGMNTEPGIIPCSNSSSSRTSRKVASPTRACASAGINPTAWVGYSQRSDAGDQGGEHGPELLADDHVGDGVERRLLRVQDH